MAITAANIKFMYSDSASSQGGSTSGSASSSLGGYTGSGEVAATLHGLFDKITGQENADSNDDYRCIFVYNDHGTLTLESAVMWISAETAGGASIEIATDDIAASLYASTSAQAGTIADADTPPTGISSFNTSTTKSGGLSLGDIGPGEVKGVWIKRLAANTTALNNDGVTLKVEGDTAA